MRFFVGLLLTLALLACQEQIVTLGPPAPDETRFVFEVGEGEQPLEQTIQQTMRTIERRMAALGLPGNAVARTGTSQIVVGVRSLPDNLRETIVRHVTTGDLLTMSILDEGTLQGDDTYQAPVLTGADIKDAEQGFDDASTPSIDFVLTETGAKKFAAATTTHVGQLLEVTIDGRIISSIRIAAPIEKGFVRISGRFTVDEAKQMATMLRSGELLAPVKLIQVIKGE